MSLDPARYPWHQEDAPDEEDTMSRPSYYALNNGQDLYALWLELYGQDATAQHLEMCALEYLWRCRHKGQYRRDLEKVQVIVARLLEWDAQEHPPFTPEEHRQMLRDIVRHGVLPPEEASHLRATIAAQDAAEEATLDDALHVLAQHGWQAVPPAAPPAAPPDGRATGAAAVDNQLTRQEGPR